MGMQNVSLLAFNRGIIDPKALARLDIERIPLSAETQTNFMPRLLGSMMLRVGLGYTGATHNNAKAYHIPFVFAKNDTAILEFTNGILRVKVDEAPITRVPVLSSITNGTFTTDLTGWTDNDEAGGTSAWVTGGYMGLTGNGTNAAKRTQQVTVAGGSEGDLNKEFALNIVINRGPVIIRVGSTSGDDDYINETKLGEGYHSLALTPTGNFFIEFSSRLKRIVYVDSVAIGSGVMTLTSPYAEADLGLIRKTQSADVIYLGCKGYKPYKIERRSTTSWSIVKYLPEDGPMRVANTTNITLTASAVSGNTTLTASKPVFKSTHIGALFKLVSTGQFVSQSVTAENTFTDAITVEGSGNRRIFTIVVSGTWVATVTLQRSFDFGVTWEDVSTKTNGTTTLDDLLDNQDIQYRIGVKTGDFTSGTVAVSLNYNLGSNTGYARITAFSSSTSVSAEILNDLGNTSATSNWSEGAWSDLRGYPSSVALHEGRLFWAGKSKVWGSVSDAYESFDEDVTGDSGVIDSTIGYGPVDDINWLIPMTRLFLGTDISEKTLATTSFEEALTPSNFRITEPSTQGSANIEPVKLDKKGLFVQSSGTRLFELSYNPQEADFSSGELTKLAPAIGEPSIIRLAAPRQPDTRIHCVRSDGKVAILCYDPVENLQGWVLVESTGASGIIEDAFILPGDDETLVYYCIKRTINGSTVRYLEKWALESECQGGTLNKQADSFITYQGPITGVFTTITGLDHLEGEEVVVWGDGKDQGTFTVSSGSITLFAVSNAVVGLGYTAQYKSSKLGYGAQQGTPLNKKKIVRDIGLILSNTHYQGLKFGADFDNLQNLPLVEDGKITGADYIWDQYDKDTNPFGGIWDTDSRICLQAQAPRPCTVLAATFGVQTSEG
jgi:hypothetical protein